MKKFFLFINIFILYLVVGLFAHAIAAGDHLYNIASFGCDVGHEQFGTLYPDGTPACGHHNCPGPPAFPPDGCWAQHVVMPAPKEGSEAGVSWKVNDKGRLQLCVEKDHQLIAWTWLYVSEAKTIKLHYSFDSGGYFINRNLIEDQDAIPLKAGWNRLECTAYHQHDSSCGGMPEYADLVSQVEIMNSSPYCVFTVISSEQVVLQNLRQFRDKILTRNEKGRQLLQLYYRHSPEVELILLKHPRLIIRSAAILKDVMPGIRFLLREEEAGRDIVMTPPLVNRIQNLFEDISKEGSQELVQTLSLLSNGLEEYKGMRMSQIFQVIDGVPPEKFLLFQNHPNPFNPDTWIPYQLSQSASITIKIYKASGQLVRTLHLGTKPAGFYLTKTKAAYWDGKDNLGEKVASGVYFYTLQVRPVSVGINSTIPRIGAGEFKATRKMVMMK